MKNRLFKILIGLMTVALFAAACAPALTPAPATAVPPTAVPPTAVPATEAPTAVPAPTEAPIAFDKTAAEEEGYWYSRYNMGSLAMISGLGDTFMPDMSMIEAMVKMADANPDDGDVPMPPMNASLLTSVYTSGDPHYTQAIDMADFGTQRWDPATFDKTVTPRTQAWLIIKELEWAKQFHVDAHFGKTSDNFGAQWRFVGLVVTAEAKMQLQYALQMLKNDKGLYGSTDGTLDNAGQWVMLEALSDAGGTFSAATLPGSDSNRYADPDSAGMFLGAADMLFGALADRVPADIEETSLAIQSLTWYAANTQNADNKAAAIAKISEFGKLLADAKPANATENAFAVRGLIEAYRVSGDSAYLSAAASAFDALYADFNFTDGVFNSQNVYSIDNVAVLMGAINSVVYYAGDAVDQQHANDLFTAVYLNLVNKSGLQQSVLPVNAGKDKFEQEEPAIFYGYPTLPMPPMAGGDFGVAPVFASEVTFSFIWFHNDEVNGFPEVTK
ncbi:MAG: hypothetical protein OHK0031_02450 [Anaerolineales bacterium]